MVNTVRASFLIKEVANTIEFCQKTFVAKEFFRFPGLDEKTCTGSRQFNKLWISCCTISYKENSKRQGWNYTNEVDFNHIHDLVMLIDDVRNNGLRIITINEIPELIAVHQKAP